jgi:hypothetical protein
VRISSANIPTQTRQSTSSTSPQAAGRSIDRRQAPAAGAYSGNAAPPPIIDAEYVEFYTPGAGIFHKERSNLDSSIAPEAPVENLSAAKTADVRTTGVDKYQQLSSPVSPRRGSFIDIFA